MVKSSNGTLGHLMQKPSLKKVTWQDVRERVAQRNAQFAKVVDKIAPGADYPLYQVRYPYGSVIVDEGTFFLANAEGELVTLDDVRLDKEIKKDLAYAGRGIPTGIVLEHAAEFFVNTPGHTLPLSLSVPGDIFSLWKKFDPVPPFHPVKIFSITAGARCIFMLPNIGDHAFHRNLKRDFNVRLLPPKELLDQWHVFKAIAHHPAAECDWSSELLFFSGKWLDSVRQDPAWRELYVLLLERVWRGSAYERNQMFYDFAMSCAQANRNLKPNPYLTDTMRHLLMMGLGAGAGFGAAIDDMAAPVSLLQKVYLECYGLRKYVPTIMLPMHFIIGESNFPIYYSLHLPTTLEFSPKSRKISSTLHDLGEVKHIMQVFIDEVLSGRLKIEDTMMGKLAENVRYDFYHSKPDPHGEIKLSEDLPKADPRLVQCAQLSEARDFAATGPFVRGCIAIRNRINRDKADD